MKRRNRYEYFHTIGQLKLVVCDDRLKRAKRNIELKEMKRWADRTHKPQGFLTLQLLFPMRPERSHKLVRRLIALVCRRYKIHIDWEGFYGRHPNGAVGNKLHYHILYRVTDGYIGGQTLEDYWIVLQSNAKSPAEVIHHKADALNGKTRTKSQKRLALDVEYVEGDCWGYAGGQYAYAYNDHSESIWGVGCPRQKRACKDDKCKHRRGQIASL